MVSSSMFSYTGGATYGGWPLGCGTKGVFRMDLICSPFCAAAGWPNPADLLRILESLFTRVLEESPTNSWCDPAYGGGGGGGEGCPRRGRTG